MTENPTTGLGLALSGGGFRATLFHLGVARALCEVGLLEKTSHIVSISGGSVLAAHMVLHWELYRGNPQQFETGAEPLLQFIESDVRNRILRRLPWGIVTRLALRAILASFGRVAWGRSREWLVKQCDEHTAVAQLRRNYERLFGSAMLERLADPH